MNKIEFYNDLGKLIKILPTKITALLKDKQLDDLIELVFDLGRLPEMRFSDGRIEYLGKTLVEEEDIGFITSQIQDSQVIIDQEFPVHYTV
jgi:stage III sporulation protein SpoIIIAA